MTTKTKVFVDYTYSTSHEASDIDLWVSQNEFQRGHATDIQMSAVPRNNGGLLTIVMLIWNN